VSLFSRVFGSWLKSPRPNTRLDEAQALEIARQAAAGEPDRDLLTIVALSDTSEKPTWIVSAAAVGNTLVVSIDDHSGQVVEMKRHGLR
jgi:hypothetical protein